MTNDGLSWGIGSTVEEAAKDAGLGEDVKIIELKRPPRTRAAAALAAAEKDENGAALAMHGAYIEGRDLKAERGVAKSRGKVWGFKA